MNSETRPGLPRRLCLVSTGLFSLVLALANAACTGSQAPPPPQPPQTAEPAAAADPRARLDEALKLASELKYDAAIALFEQIKAERPQSVTPLDGLRFVVVYAAAGNQTKHEALTRWLLDRYQVPKEATEAERAVKGYVVHAGSNDPGILAKAVELTRFASEHAVRDGQGDFQGFFDTSRGVALYRVGRYAEAAKWLPKTLGHESLYVRSLAQPFNAMNELARGNKARAQALFAQARATAKELPAPGSDQYGIEWTDIVISRMVMAEAEARFK